MDVPHRLLHLFRDPQPSGYRIHQSHSANDQVTPLLFDRASLAVAELFRCLDV